MKRKSGPPRADAETAVQRVLAHPGITVAEATNRWRGWLSVAAIVLSDPRVKTTTNRLGGIQMWPAGQSVSTGPVSRRAQRKRLDPAD